MSVINKETMSSSGIWKQLKMITHRKISETHKCKHYKLVFFLRILCRQNYLGNMHHESKKSRSETRGRKELTGRGRG